MATDFKEATEYLETGGIGEVYGLAEMSLRLGAPKVQIDADMAMALCLLANEALNRRKAH